MSFNKIICEIYTSPKTSNDPLVDKAHSWGFQNMAPFPGQRQGQVLSLFKESHPQDIFVVMWKKRLGNPLSDGMAGMRNGNSFAFYTVSGKGNKNKKSIGVGQHSQCLS